MAITTFPCSRCGTILEVPDDLKTEQFECPQCRISYAPLEKRPPSLRKIILITSTLVTLLFIMVAAFSAHNSSQKQVIWEEQHGPEIIADAKSVSELAEQDKPKEVLDAIHNLQTLVGERKLHDPEIKEAFEDAIKLADKSQERLTEQMQKAESLKMAAVVQRKQQEVSLPTMAVDIDWPRLPQGFRGDDAVLLYDRIQDRLKKVGNQTDTEADAAYTERLRVAFEMPIVGQISAQTYMGFVPDIKLQYDANRQIATCSDSYLNAPYATFRDDHGNYIGENIFGVQRVVDKSESETMRLSISNRNAFERIEISIPPSAVEKLLSNIRPLLVCRLVPPYSDIGMGHTKPTIDSPHEYWETSRLICVILEEVWLVRIDTGEILCRQGPWTNDPVRILQKTADAMPYYGFQTNASTLKHGDVLSGRLSRVSANIWNYEIDYSWINSKWELVGGTRTDIKTGIRINLKPEYRDFATGEECVPTEFRDSLEKVIRSGQD